MPIEVDENLTATRLAAFVVELTLERIPARVLERAELSVLDTLASALGGAVTSNARQMRDAADVYFGAGESSVWFTSSTAHRAAALLANCAASSALDIDDGHRGASGHAGAAIVPAVLQVAKELGWRDGRAILAAIAIGYDVALRIASARRPGTVKTYSSGRWTGYGVAAAIAWMRRLPIQTMVHAITIAGAESPENLPAGSYRRLSSVKGSSPWSTLTALLAVERAIAGADGPEDSLDRAEIYDPSAIVDRLGERWAIEETYFKPYASCRYTHPSIDAVLEIARENAIDAAGISQLSVEVFPAAFTITNEIRPATLESAQFSIPFCLALATLRGGAAFRPMTEVALGDPAVLDLSARVKMTAGADFTHSFPATTPSRVRLVCGGRTFEKTVIHPLGDVLNPLRRTDALAKLIDLGRPNFSVANAEMLASASARLLDGDTTLLSLL